MPGVASLRAEIGAYQISFTHIHRPLMTVNLASCTLHRVRRVSAERPPKPDGNSRTCGPRLGPTRSCARQRSFVTVMLGWIIESIAAGSGTDTCAINNRMRVCKRLS